MVTQKKSVAAAERDPWQRAAFTLAREALDATQVVGPTLVPGQVVVLDNLSAQTHPRIAELLADRGCCVRYLPSSSPDDSPIELAIAKIKTALRRTAARTAEGLLIAIATAMAAITASDARASFRHCGFCIQPDLDQWFCTSLSCASPCACTTSLLLAFVPGGSMTLY